MPERTEVRPLSHIGSGMLLEYVFHAGDGPFGAGRTGAESVELEAVKLAVLDFEEAVAREEKDICGDDVDLDELLALANLVVFDEAFTLVDREEADACKEDVDLAEVVDLAELEDFELVTGVELIDRGVKETDLVDTEFGTGFLVAVPLNVVHLLFESRQ